MLRRKPKMTPIMQANKLIFAEIYSQTVFHMSIVALGERKPYYAEVFDDIYDKAVALELHFIGDNIDVIGTLFKVKLREKLAPYASLFDDDGKLSFKSMDTSHSEGSNTLKHGEERQPINSSLEELTSPTYKSRDNGNTEFDATSESAFNANKKIELYYKYDNFIKVLDSIFKSLIVEYNSIY